VLFLGLADYFIFEEMLVVVDEVELIVSLSSANP